MAELSLLPAVYWLYAAIRDHEGRAQQPVDFARAQIHGEQIMRIEGDVGLAWERAIQGVVLYSAPTVRALDSFWSYGYMVVTLLVLATAFRQRPAVYRRLRSTFGLSTFAAIATFAAFPAVPPRLLPSSYGIIDTWAQTGGIGARNPPQIERLSDPFASFPSIHVAWATWCVIAVWTMTPKRWLRALTGVYLAMTVVAVIATGNHFILDCAVGAVLPVVALIWVVGTEGARERLAVRVRHLGNGLVHGPDPVPVPESAQPGPRPAQPIPLPVAVAVAAGSAGGMDEDRENSTALTA